MSRVWPSEADRATASAPKLPAAPGRFSTMKLCLRVADSVSAIARARRSTGTPGRPATTILTGSCGEGPAQDLPATVRVLQPDIAAASRIDRLVNMRPSLVAPGHDCLGWTACLFRP